jgi:hypothetical protein
MKLSEIVIKNFQLLQDARMRLDRTDITTILVGPNNSVRAKTKLDCWRVLASPCPATTCRPGGVAGPK